MLCHPIYICGRWSFRLRTGVSPLAPGGLAPEPTHFWRSRRRIGRASMTSSPAATERPAAKDRRHPPMLVGLVVIAVISGAYLGWQNFARSPSSTPGPPAPVPVIATTVQPRDFPIVLTGIGNTTALNSATVRSMVTEQIFSIDFKDGEFGKKGPAPGSARSEHVSGPARPGRGQSHPRPGPSRKWADQPRSVYPVAKARLCAGATGRHAASDDRAGGGHDQSRSGGNRICQDPAELYEAGSAI